MRTLPPLLVFSPTARRGVPQLLTSQRMAALFSRNVWKHFYLRQPTMVPPPTVLPAGDLARGSSLFGNANEDRVSILTSLDLSAAFDALDHSILPARLRDMFGISGKAFEWFCRIYLTDSSLSASTVGSLHRKSFIMGSFKIMSWALFSLLCAPSHCLISSPKVGAIITNLLTTLNFTNHQLHLNFIH